MAFRRLAAAVGGPERRRLFGARRVIVNARAVKNLPGPGQDKKDAVWLAKLTERGMLQPSFIPDYDIRRLREFTRLRAELVHERTRHWSRLEKLLERALINVTSVASAIDTMSCRDMIEALIAGQRDPRALADLARGKMRAKRKALIELWTGSSRTTTPWRPASCCAMSTTSPRHRRPDRPGQRAGACPHC